MSHQHTHIEEHHHNHMGHNHHGEDVKNIKVAFFLNFGFAIIEIIGGLYTNSMAILSDAIHDLGDSLSLGMSWYFQKLSRKQKDNKYTYGYKRFSLVGALVNSIVLTVGSILIIIEAVPRLINPEQANAKGMIVLAILGVIINGAAVLRLKRGKSLNERVVSLHLFEDVLGWIAVLIGAIIMTFVDFPIIDPILSLLIAGYILFNVFRNLKDIFRIILQGTPIEVNSNKITDEIIAIEPIKEIHDLHLWSIDGMYNIMTIHVLLSKKLEMDALATLKGKIREISKKNGVEHITIEFETKNEDCSLESCGENLEKEDILKNKVVK